MLKVVKPPVLLDFYISFIDKTLSNVLRILNAQRFSKPLNLLV
nr:MAG TPA: hypothetical protein [Caudoviricetes sp.]